MIFSKNHIEEILKGIKTQTRRSSGRYMVGRTYSVQPCRTCKGISEGRIKILNKRFEVRQDPVYLSISFEDAQAEGGYAPQNYEDLYGKMHPMWSIRWAYDFEFIPTCQKSETE